MITAKCISCLEIVYVWENAFEFHSTAETRTIADSHDPACPQPSYGLARISHNSYAYPIVTWDCWVEDGLTSLVGMPYLTLINTVLRYTNA